MAGQGIVVLSVIVLTPVIVHAVGATDYGVWVLFGSIASFGLLLELGIAAALVKYVAEHAARGEVREAALMAGAATWLYALAGGLLTLLGVILALVLPSVVELHGAFARLFRPMAILVGLNIGVSMLAITPVAVLRALQRFPAANAIMGGGALLTAILTVLALVLDFGIVGVAAANAAATILAYAASIVVARRAAPGFMTVLIRRDGARARRLLRFSRSVAVIQVAIRLQSRLDAVVIAAALPVRLLAPYNFGLNLSNGIGTATDQFAKLLLPMAAEAGVGQDPPALRRLFLTSTRLTMAITLAVGLPVALLGGPILRVWVGPSFAGYGAVVALLAAAAIVGLPSYPAAAVLQGIERHGPIAWMALAGGVFNVALSIALVGPLGINGVAAATLIATAVEITLLVVPYASRVLGVSLRDYTTAVVLRLAPSAALLAAMLLAERAILPVTSLIRLAIVVAVAELVYCAAYATLGAAPTERDAYRAAARAVIRAPARLRSRRAPTTTSAP